MTDFYSQNETILDRCVNAIYDQGKSIEDCLDQYPDQRESLEPLLRLTARLQEAKQLTAPSDFRLSARERLEQRLAAYPAPAVVLQPSITTPPTLPQHRDGRQSAGWQSTGQRRSSWRPITLPRLFPSREARVFAAALMIIFVLLFTNTLIVSANRSLPGQTMFPMKVAAEKVQLALTASQAAQADLHLQFAERRYNEFKTLIDQGQMETIDQAIQLYTGELASAHSSAQSGTLTALEKEQIALRLAGKVAEHSQDLTAMTAQWQASHPGATEAAARHTEQDANLLIQSLDQLYNSLLKENPDLPKLRESLPQLPTLETATPTIVKQIATATPMPPAATATPQPNNANTTSGREPSPADEGERIPDRPDPADYPTVITAWATQIREIPPVITPGAADPIIGTYWPGELPTQQPDTSIIQTVVPIVQTAIPNLPELPPAPPNWPPVNGGGDGGGGGGGGLPEPPPGWWAP